jgi:hypothetical protein
MSVVERCFFGEAGEFLTARELVIRGTYMDPALIARTVLLAA